MQYIFSKSSTFVCCVCVHLQCWAGGSFSSCVCVFSQNLQFPSLKFTPQNFPDAKLQGRSSGWTESATLWSHQNWPALADSDFVVDNHSSLFQVFRRWSQRQRVENSRNHKLVFSSPAASHVQVRFVFVLSNHSDRRISVRASVSRPGKHWHLVAELANWFVEMPRWQKRMLSWHLNVQICALLWGPKLFCSCRSWRLEVRRDRDCHVCVPLNVWESWEVWFNLLCHTVAELTNWPHPSGFQKTIVWNVVWSNHFAIATQ